MPWPMAPGRRALAGFAMDSMFWLCMPAVFLFVCIDGHLLPADAVAPHLRIMMSLLLGLAVFRLTLSVAGVNAAAARAATALAAAALLALMLSYYLLTVIGLQSWGRVVSWDLIASYGAQAFRLAETLGISVPIAIGAAGLAYLALLVAAWIYLEHFDWAPLLRRKLSAPLTGLIALAGGTVCATELYHFLAAPPTRQSEPVSLTFYPTEGAWDVEGHAIDRLRATRFDAAEDSARRSYRPGSAVERRNVILIVVDALRPDRLGIYGYGRDTTPNLARLEKAGMMRKAASVRAACASSFCGLVSIGSSKFLHQFSRRPITLQETLRRNGYRTHMILSGDHTLFYNLKQVYGEVDSYFDARETQKIRYLNDDRLVLERLAAFPSWDGAPVMIQFHLMSAHLLGSRDPSSARYTPAANYLFVASRGHAVDGRPSEQVTNYYDNGVQQADAVIGEILDALGRKGYLQNSVVAITADHGEALGEHGLYQHANSVHEEVLRIPFMLISYGYQATGAFDGRVASQVDIAPTLLAEASIPLPATWKGKPLQQPAARNFLYFQERWEAGVFDLRDPANLWKYWTNLKTGEEFAFNLSLDPQERLNAIGQASLQQKRAWRAEVLAASAVGGKRRPGADPG
jgi:glucan phosphoethanolaminetransferase (alkaline phosphatase superfamily)